MRAPLLFEEAKNEDEELLIHQEGILFTSNEAIDPITTLQMASARVIDVQQLGNFVPFSDPNLFAKLFHHLFPFGYGHPGTERKVTVGLQQCVKHYFKHF